jgi:hypothetical protein
LQPDYSQYDQGNAYVANWTWTDYAAYGYTKAASPVLKVSGVAVATVGTFAGQPEAIIAGAGLYAAGAAIDVATSIYNGASADDVAWQAGGEALNLALMLLPGIGTEAEVVSEFAQSASEAPEALAALEQTATAGGSVSKGLQFTRMVDAAELGFEPVAQEAAMDCGQASLANALRNRGVNASLSDVLDVLKYDPAGVKAPQLIDAAQEGFGWVGGATYQATMETMLADLAEGNGVIAQLGGGSRHFVYVVKQAEGGLLVVDPAQGAGIVNEAEFASWFNKETATLRMSLGK